MMDLLKRSDIERAREELAARRAATLKRQSEELERLAAEGAEIELLGRLAAAFSQKYKRPPAPVGKPPALAEAVVKRPAKPPAMPHSRISEPAHPADRRQLAGTNFDMFSRAVFKSSF